MSRKSPSDGAVNVVTRHHVSFAMVCLLAFAPMYRACSGHGRVDCRRGEAQPAVIIEVLGAVDAPGIYFFSSPPSVVNVCAAAGVDQKVLNKAEKLHGQLVSGGCSLLLEARDESLDYCVKPMEAGKRLALGVPLDLNRVSADDLIALPGVGPETAAAIVEFRDRNGPFSAINQLDAVKGIGTKRLRELRKYLVVD